MTTANVNKLNRFCYYIQKGHCFRENLVSVIVSTILNFLFVVQLLLVAQLYVRTIIKTYDKKQHRTYHYKPLES